MSSCAPCLPSAMRGEPVGRARRARGGVSASAIAASTARSAKRAELGHDPVERERAGEIAHGQRGRQRQALAAQRGRRRRPRLRRRRGQAPAPPRHRPARAARPAPAAAAAPARGTANAPAPARSRPANRPAWPCSAWLRGRGQGCEAREPLPKAGITNPNEVLPAMLRLSCALAAALATAACAIIPEDDARPPRSRPGKFPKRR